MTLALEAAGLTCRYGARVVVRDASLSAAPGTLTAILGPNGAGKSTLLLALAGLVHSEGSLKLCGEDARALSRRALAQRLAIVLQDPPTDAPFTVAELVLMGRAPHLSRLAIEGEKDRRIAEEAMRSADMLSLAERPIDQLSGGEKRRAFLARALAQQPKVLLLDEPTAFLDLGHQAQLMAHCRRLTASGLAIVAVLHDPNLASAHADQVVLMKDGATVERGPSREVLTREKLEALYGTALMSALGPSGQPVFAPLGAPLGR